MESEGAGLRHGAGRCPRRLGYAEAQTLPPDVGGGRCGRTKIAILASLAYGGAVNRAASLPNGIKRPWRFAMGAPTPPKLGLLPEACWRGRKPRPPDPEAASNGCGVSTHLGSPRTTPGRGGMGSIKRSWWKANRSAGDCSTDRPVAGAGPTAPPWSARHPHNRRIQKGGWRRGRARILCLAAAVGGAASGRSSTTRHANYLRLQTMRSGGGESPDRALLRC